MNFLRQGFRKLSYIQTDKYADIHDRKHYHAASRIVTMTALTMTHDLLSALMGLSAVSNVTQLGHSHTSGARRQRGRQKREGSGIKVERIMR